MNTPMKLFSLLIITVMLAACSSMGVEPWERDILSEADMQLDADPVLLGLDDHTYFSKEASSGGRAFGGGGCGCN
jgi:hypothetical protein